MKNGYNNIPRFISNFTKLRKDQFVMSTHKANKCSWYK